MKVLAGFTIMCVHLEAVKMLEFLTFKVVSSEKLDFFDTYSENTFQNKS